MLTSGMSNKKFQTGKPTRDPTEDRWLAQRSVSVSVPLLDAYRRKAVERLRDQDLAIILNKTRSYVSYEGSKLPPLNEQIENLIDLPDGEFRRSTANITVLEKLALFYRYATVISQRAELVGPEAVLNMNALIEEVGPRYQNLARIRTSIIGSKMAGSKWRGQASDSMQPKKFQILVADVSSIQHLDEIIGLESQRGTSQNIPSLPYTTFAITPSDKLLFSECQLLLGNLNEFALLWQTLGMDNPIRKGIPAPLRDSIILACEHLIRCLKNDVVDVATTSKLKALLTRSLKNVGHASVIAAVAAATTVGVNEALGSSDQEKIINTCAELVARSHQIDDQIHMEWVNPKRRSDKFDFGLIQ